MKTLLLAALLTLPLASALADVPTERIILHSDQSFDGPITHVPALATGDTLIVITAEQYAAVDALRRANPGAPVVFDGTAFALSPGETIRRQLTTDLLAQPIGVQVLFGSMRDFIRDLLRAGMIARAKEVIQTTPLPASPAGGPDLEAVRALMLSRFPTQ